MFLEIHPDNPQPRLIQQVVSTLKKGGIIIYPTDSNYSFACMVGNQEGMNRIRQIREVDDSHFFSLICHDLSELSKYAFVDNRQFRLLKAVLPGAYTFILKGSKDISKKLLNPKRKTIGLRIPNHIITQSIVEALGEPILSTTVSLEPHSSEFFSDIYEIQSYFENRVDAIIDGGPCSNQPTTVIDLSSGNPEIIREGQAPIDLFI